MFGSAFFVVSTLGVLTLPLATEALFSISLPLAPALAVLAAAALLSGAAFVAEQYLRRALTDEATGLPNLAALEIATRSEEHTSELQSLMRISYAVFCLKKKKKKKTAHQKKNKKTKNHKMNNHKNIKMNNSTTRTYRMKYR